jgi:hypothetical protein
MLNETTKINLIGGYSLATTIPRHIKKLEKERGKKPTSVTWTEDKEGNLALTLNFEE